MGSFRTLRRWATIRIEVGPFRWAFWTLLFGLPIGGLCAIFLDAGDVVCFFALMLAWFPFIGVLHQARTRDLDLDIRASHFEHRMVRGSALVSLFVWPAIFGPCRLRLPILQFWPE